MNEDPNRIRVGDRITIYQRGSKRTWVADFWQDNLHRRVSLRTTNKKIAVERATKIASELHQGMYQTAPPQCLLTQAVDDYLTHLKTKNRARRTLVKYRGVFDRFLEYLTKLRITRIAQVTAMHFDRYRSELSVTDHRKTVYGKSVIVKHLFKWSRIRKLIREDPLADITFDKPPLEPKEGPSLDQVNAVLAAATGPIMSHLAVLSFTGMRAGELQRLRPEDIDLVGGWIHIRSREGGETKTRESRKVPIHARLRAVLESLLKTSRPWLFTAAPSKKFPTGGHHISVKRLNEQFTRLVGRLGMPVGRESGFVVHSLRHFFETFTVNAGIPQRVIDTWLGHRSDKSMAAHYYKLSDGDSQSFMRKVPFSVTAPATEAGNKEV